MTIYCKNEWCDHATMDAEIETTPEEFECFICDRDLEDLKEYLNEYIEETKKDPSDDNIHMIMAITRTLTNKNNEQI